MYKNGSKFSAAATLKFDGANSMNLVFRDGVTHEADDILLRFRTREQSGVLLTTVHDRSADKLDVLLEGGRVRALCDMHGQLMICEKETFSSSMRVIDIDVDDLII